MGTDQLDNECAFNLWWDKYPRKEDKKKAREKYMKALDGGTTVEDLDSGLDHYLAYLKQEGTRKKYIKHAKTWLHGENWNDEHEIELPPMWQRDYEEWTAEEKHNTHRMLEMGFPPANMRITPEQARRLKAEFSDNVVKLEVG